MGSEVVNPKVAEALKYIKYAYDAYIPCYSETNFKKGIETIDGDRTKPYNDVNAWLAEKNYVPILSLKAAPGAADPVNKFYGICAYDAAKREIIIAFRGTVFFGYRDHSMDMFPFNPNKEEFMQYYTNSWSGPFFRPANLAPACEVKTYKGTACNVNTVFTGILENIKLTYKKFIAEKSSVTLPVKIVFCGHSLGAALAQLAAAEYISETTTTGVAVEVVAYGSPKVGDATFTSFLEYNLDSSSCFIVNEYDPVPTLYVSGLAPEWNYFYQVDDFYDIPAPVRIPQFINFADPAGIVILENTSPACIITENLTPLSAYFCHAINYYYEGLKTIAVDNPQWNWSAPVAIAAGSNHIKPAGDYAVTSYETAGKEYLVVAYPVFLNRNYLLSLAIFDGTSWTFFPNTAIPILQYQGVELGIYLGNLYACCNKSDNTMMLYQLSITTGQVISTMDVTAQTGEKGGKSPALLTSFGKLYFIYHDTSISNLRTFSMHFEIEPDGQVKPYFSQPGNLSSGADSKDTPAVCSVASSGGYMVYRGKSADSLYYSDILYDEPGKTEFDWKQYGTSYKSKKAAGVAILNTKDKMYAICCYKTSTMLSSALYSWFHDLTKLDGPTQMSILDLSSGTDNAVAVVNYKNAILMFFCDDNNNDYLSYSQLS